MNQREKLLTGLVGGIAFLFVVFGFRWVFLSPLKEVDKKIALVRERLGKIQAERRNYFAAEDRLKQITRTSFADTVDQASARSGEMLTRQITVAGLEEPFSPACRWVPGSSGVPARLDGTSRAMAR